MRNQVLDLIHHSDKETRDFFKVVLGEFDRIDKRKANDTEYQKVIDKMYKNAKELNNVIEMQLLKPFLVQKISIGEIEDFVVKVNLTNKGAIMGSLKKEFGNTVDMADANRVVTEYLKTI